MPNASFVFVIASFSWLFGMCLLLWFWLPSLEQLNALYGFDSARYYYRSIDLLESGFDIYQVRGGLADPGILYFYAIVMAAFGKNVFSPYFVNYILFLIFLVLLIRSFRYGINKKNLWFFAGLMLLPELVWFSVLSGKDFLIAVLAGILLIWFVKISDKKSPAVSLTLKTAALFAFIAITLIRPT